MRLRYQKRVFGTGGGNLFEQLLRILKEIELFVRNAYLDHKDFSHASGRSKK